MHPYNPWHHMGPRCYRGPSRLIWFILGAGAATWWIKHKEMQHPAWGHCRRPAIQNAPMSNNNSPAPPSGSNGGSPYPGTDTPANADPSFTFKDIPRTINNLPPSGASWNWGWGERKEAEKWTEEQDKLAELRRQATETMTNVTEATLESILTAAEVLKAKLAESRSQRKKQQEQLDPQIEEQSKNPPRLV